MCRSCSMIWFRNTTPLNPFTTFTLVRFTIWVQGWLPPSRFISSSYLFFPPKKPHKSPLPLARTQTESFAFRPWLLRTRTNGSSLLAVIWRHTSPVERYCQVRPKKKGCSVIVKLFETETYHSSHEAFRVPRHVAWAACANWCESEGHEGPPFCPLRLNWNLYPVLNDKQRLPCMAAWSHWLTSAVSRQW